MVDSKVVGHTDLTFGEILDVRQRLAFAFGKLRLLGLLLLAGAALGVEGSVSGGGKGVVTR